MSTVTLNEGSVLWLKSKAISRPSGDQSKSPTTKVPEVRRFAAPVSTLTRWRCRGFVASSSMLTSPNVFCRSFMASVFGSEATKAIRFPSPEKAKRETPSSADVRARDSPPDRFIT
jgi:hypothetical protein